ncbi:hypothetical protein ACFLZ2_06095, partial [Candidatus Margulisiibacteriota bacterium]
DAFVKAISLLPSLLSNRARFSKMISDLADFVNPPIFWPGIIAKGLGVEVNTLRTGKYYDKRIMGLAARNLEQTA